ncbi:MAG: DUF4838 domain-containing protein [Chloroflexi bacterium]|nr:DUF4838 domain-containing protein [Chloroflexota bacterium]
MATTGKLTLVHNGQGRYAIVIPADAAAPVKHGADELQQHLAMMSGAILPIQETVPETDLAICLEPTASLGEEEFTLKTSGQRLTISGGGKRGVLYGCYALLEDILGVRWYTSRITYVPKKRTLTVDPLDVHDKPDFEYREPFYTEAFAKDWAVRNRTNGHHQLLDESVGGNVSYGRLFVHTFNDLVSPDKYYDAHPEYFSLIDGKRMKGYYQLCLTNPDVLRISIESVRGWIKENPHATIISVSQNDVYFNCQCDKCRAVEEEEGAASGLVLRFVNAIADAIAAEYPHILIDTLAYQWTESTPKYVRPRPNVRIRLAPIYACFSHPLDGCAANIEAFNNLKAWGAITNQLYVWHYSTNFAHYLQPFPNLDEVIGDIPIFKKYGAVGLFYEGGYAPGGMCAQSELEAYLMAKLMWHTDRPAEPIIADFLQGVYGKAAPYIKEWLDLIHDVLRKQNWHLRIWDTPTAPYLADDVLAKGQRIFDAAEQAVADNTLTLEMVQRARLALDYVLLMRALPRHQVVGSTYKRTQGVDAKLLSTLETKVNQYGVGQIREGQPKWRFFQRVTDQSEYPVLSLANEQVRVDVVPALGGRIVRLLDKASGQNLLREVTAAEWSYPAGGGFAEYVGIEDRGMGAREAYQGTLNKGNAQTPASIILEVMLKNGVAVKRCLSLQGDRLDIKTELANTTAEVQHIALRSVIELTWPDGVEPSVLYRSTAGETVQLAIPEPGHPHEMQYADIAEGEWTAQLGKVQLTQVFANQPIAAVSCNGSRMDRGLSLALNANPRALPAGAKFTLEQSWIITQI